MSSSLRNDFWNFAPVNYDSLQIQFNSIRVESAKPREIVRETEVKTDRNVSKFFFFFFFLFWKWKFQNLEEVGDSFRFIRELFRRILQSYRNCKRFRSSSRLFEFGNEEDSSSSLNPILEIDDESDCGSYSTIEQTLSNLSIATVKSLKCN